MICCRRHLLPIALLSLLGLIGSAGCLEDAPPSNLATIKMQIGRKQFTLEVADTEASRETGLMNRDSMPDDHGMIFVFAEEDAQNFWMKNTRIPLDILFVAADGKVVSIKKMQPFDLRNTSSDGPARFAIELNSGAASNSGAKPGDKLSIPADLKAK